MKNSTTISLYNLNRDGTYELSDFNIEITTPLDITEPPLIANLNKLLK